MIRKESSTSCTKRSKKGTKTQSLNHNIFYLDEDPDTCAMPTQRQALCQDDCRVRLFLCHPHIEYLMVWNIKVVLQKLVDVSHDNFCPRWLSMTLYKVAHLNYPSTKWVRVVQSHYAYLYDSDRTLCEHTYRYGKIHETQSQLEGHCILLQ